MTIPINLMFGFAENTMSKVAFVPQIIKSFRRKKVDDLRIGMFVLLFSTQLYWIGYAIFVRVRKLWASSLTKIALSIPIFILWVKHRISKS